MLKRIFSLLSLLLFLTSCAAQKTIFFSEPPGAQVSINGEFIGTTPCKYRYREGNGKSYQIELRKAHYQTITQNIKTDAVDKASRKKWLVAGLVWSPLWLGTLFTRKLRESYHFVLSKIGQAKGTFAEKGDSFQMPSKMERDALRIPAGTRKSS